MANTHWDQHKIDPIYPKIVLVPYKRAPVFMNEELSWSPDSPNVLFSFELMALLQISALWRESSLGSGTRATRRPRSTHRARAVAPTTTTSSPAMAASRSPCLEISSSGSIFSRSSGSTSARAAASNSPISRGATSSSRRLCSPGMKDVQKYMVTMLF